jgi:membrane protease YdiL (CAAX protease family)
MAARGRVAAAAEALAEPLLALGLGFLLTLLVSLPLLPATELDPSRLLTADAFAFPRLLAVQAAVFTLLGAMLMRRGWPWRARPEPPPAAPPSTSLLVAGLLGLAGGIAAVLLSGIGALILAALGLPVEEQAWVEELLRQPRALLRLAPWIVLVVPASEEVFFRGYVFRFVRDRLGLGAGLACSSTVFAAVHLNPPGFALYLIVALVFAWVYQRCGRLAAPILAHAVLNGYVLAGAVLAGRGTPT